MTKKIVIVILTLILSLSLTSTALAVNMTNYSENTLSTENESTKEQQVFYTVTEYLDFVDQCFVNESLDEKKFNIFFSNKNVESSELKKQERATIEVQIENRQLYSIDIRYSSIESQYKLEKIKFDDDAAEVTVLKSEIRKYYTDKEPEQGFNNPHVFILEKCNDTWYIIKHNYSDEFKDLLETKTESEKIDWSTAKNQYLAEAEKIIDAEHSETKEIIEKYGSLEAYNEIINNKVLQDLEKQKESTKSYTYHGYDEDDAVEFAEDYVESTSYPSPYHYYSGDDCTNFTSICLTYGGIGFDDVGTYQWYFYSTTNKTAEFTAARYFRSYAVNNVGSTSIKGLFSNNGIYATASPGDIIQLYSDSTAYHSMIVIYTTDDDIRIAQHTNNGYYWLSSKPATRYYRDIYGSYY